MSRRKLIKEQVFELDGYEDGSGAECLYFAMGRAKWALKLYSDRGSRDTAFRGQKRAYARGMAPAVGKRCVIIYDGAVCFAYETKRAEAIDLDINSHADLYDEQIRRLEDRLRRIGFGEDMHEDNCGIINGKLVCIDFGECSQS